MSFSTSMSTSTIPTVLPTNVGNPMHSTGMTSEEMHVLLSLPFAPASRSLRHASHQGRSDNLSGPSQPAILNPRYPTGLQQLQQLELEWQEWDRGSPRPGQNTPPEAVISTPANQGIGDIPNDYDWPGLPKYADFAATFTSEEYMALAICYDIYGIGTSKIVAADHSFETRRAAVLDLYWRFQAYDVFQSMKSLENPGKSSELGDSVSSHYSDITWSSSSRDNEHPSSSALATPIPTHLTARMEQGDLAARLLQANENSLSRRRKADQGIRKWNHNHESCFRKRHGGPSPLGSDISPPPSLSLAETFFQDMERRIREMKGKKSPTSSSSSYGTKSGYHSRSSSFSSESHIPGTIRGGEEFPFGYPLSVVESPLDVLLGTVVHGNHSAISSSQDTTVRRKKRKPEEEAPPAPASTKTADSPLKSVLRPPKSAPSAWQLYFTDWVHKQKLSGTRKPNVAQAAKEAGQAYASLSPSEKEPYKRRSQAMKEAYEKEREAYMHTPEDIKRENLFRAAERKADKLRLSNIKDPNAPKKPLSAYFMFLQRIHAHPQLAHDVYGDETETTKQSVLAAMRWRAMTDAERQPYLAQAHQEKMEYEAARRMYEEGLTGFGVSNDLSILPDNPHFPLVKLDSESESEDFFTDEGERLPEHAQSASS